MHANASRDRSTAQKLDTPLGSYIDTLQRIYSLKASRFWKLGFNKRRAELEEAAILSRYGQTLGTPEEIRSMTKYIAQRYENHKRVVEAEARGMAVLLRIDGKWENGKPDGGKRAAMLAHIIRPTESRVFEKINLDVITMWNEITVNAVPYSWTAELDDKGKADDYPYYFSLGILENYVKRLEYLDRLGVEQLKSHCSLVSQLRSRIDTEYLIADGKEGDSASAFKKTIESVERSGIYMTIAGFFENLRIGKENAQNLLYEEVKLRVSSKFMEDARRIWNAHFPDGRGAPLNGQPGHGKFIIS